MLKAVSNFVNYWYFRYSLVTELYMVEKWERVMIHIVFFIILSAISIFNWKVVLTIATLLYEPSGAGLFKSTCDLVIILGFMYAYVVIDKKQS